MLLRLTLLAWLVPAIACAATTVTGVSQQAATQPAFTDLSGSSACGQQPALTGDTTTSAGSCATTSNLHKISTQTASAAASIAWTGLATYNNYFMHCRAVYPATNATTIRVQFGEGGTPTWEVASYKQAGVFVAASASTVNGDNSASEIGINIYGSASNLIVNSLNISMMIYNLPATGVNKQISFASSHLSATPDFFFVNESGAYVGDTNAITAIRLIADSGNINGTCELFGIIE